MTQEGSPDPLAQEPVRGRRIRHEVEHHRERALRLDVLVIPVVDEEVRMQDVVQIGCPGKVVRARVRGVGAVADVAGPATHPRHRDVRDDVDALGDRHEQHGVAREPGVDVPGRLQVLGEPVAEFDACSREVVREPLLGRPSPPDDRLRGRQRPAPRLLTDLGEVDACPLAGLVEHRGIGPSLLRPKRLQDRPGLSSQRRSGFPGVSSWLRHLPRPLSRNGRSHRPTGARRCPSLQSGFMIAEGATRGGVMRTGQARQRRERERPIRARSLVAITGCDSGIGKALAEALADQGRPVAVSYLGENPFVDDPRIRAHRMDLRRAADADAWVAWVRGLCVDGVELDTVISNAGIALGGPIENLPLDVFRECFEVDFFGTVRIVQAFIPDVIRNCGTIAVVGSLAGRVAVPFLSPYAATKFALEGFCDSLRREMNPFGVRTVLFEPGAVATPIWNKAKKQDISFVAPAYLDSLAAFRDTFIEGGQPGHDVRGRRRCHGGHPGPRPAACAVHHRRRQVGLDAAAPRSSSDHRPGRRPPLQDGLRAPSRPVVNWRASVGSIA